LIPGEYKRIEEKTKARKDLFARMRQEIRERSIRDALSNSGDELFLQDPEKNLVAYHNISEENLMRAADLGGLPVPSIAVTKRDVPFDKFGDITLIGNREMIDPKNKGNEVYSRDAWTTRFPDIVYDKPKSKDIKAFWAKVKDSFARFGDDGRREISEIDYRISSGESRDRIASSLQSSLGMMYKYLTEIKGEKIDIPQSFNRYDIRKQLREKIDEKKFNAYLNHLLDDVYRNPQIMDGRKKKPITLENVVSAMLKKRGASKEDSLTFGNGKILASISDRYKSLADIRKAKSNLTDSEKAAVSADVFAEKADAYRSLAAKHYNGDTWDAMDDAGRALVAAAKNGGTRSAIEASLRRHGFGEVTPEMLDAAVETLKAAKDVKTDYFEAKPLRAVGFNEFSAAVVSKGTKKETIDFLKSQGLTVKEYDAEKQGDRQRAVEEVQSEKPDVLFQFAGKKAKTADISKMKEAQRMKESGASTREIWNATGWVQGKDGEWRIEISDNLNDIDLKRLELLEETKLSSIYKNPALYKAYPFLKNVTNRIEKMGKRDWGYASKEDNEIVLNSKKLSSDDAKESKKMVVHEIQHMIQFHEGFAVGGDEDYVREDFKKLLDKDKRLKRRSKKWLYKHIAGEMEARATEARAERYTNRQEEIAQAKEDAAEAKETFEEVKRESTPEQLAAMRKRQALQRAILKAYETEGDISDEMEMRREELEEQMGDDLADAYDDMLFAQEEYEAIKEGKGKMPTPRPHFHDALVSFGGMDMPYSAKTEDANAEKTDDTFYQRASAPRQAIKKGMDEANKREADNLDRAAKSAMEKLDAKAAKAAERDAKKKEKLDAWKKEQREKDIAEGRIIQKGNVEIRRGDDNGQLGLFNWLINSPSRLAEKFKAFKPFFVLADKAMKKLTRLRETWSKDLSDALAVAGNKESRGTLYQILLDGDAEGKNYTDAELKEKGASEEIIKAYQSVRKLLDDVIYPAVDDARRRAKVYTKEKTRAEAAKENLTTCRNDLATLKAESQAAKASLQTANDELRKASESFKQYEKERDRVGNRLRNQRNIWEALFFIAAGVAVAR
ncbi:MAG: hypothetical protein IJ812_05455, partial [Schwartzia sp.]|nr:hypothetical protein [Schwartzia sp. (in: firmicutes)]